jgi:hypothetical protein
MTSKTRLAEIQTLKFQVSDLMVQISKLESVQEFEILFKNGSVFRSFDLSSYSMDEQRILKAYKFLFEDKNKTQQEIGTWVFQWATGKDSASVFTINRSWDVTNIVETFSFAQFKRAILKATKGESASIAQAFNTKF